MSNEDIFSRLRDLKSPIFWNPISFKNNSWCDKAYEQNEIETIENIKTHDWVSQNVSMFKLNIDTWTELVSTPSSCHCCVRDQWNHILRKIAKPCYGNLQFQKKVLGKKKINWFFNLLQSVSAWLRKLKARETERWKGGGVQEAKWHPVVWRFHGPQINRLQAHSQTLHTFFWIIMNDKEEQTFCCDMCQRFLKLSYHWRPYLDVSEGGNIPATGLFRGNFEHVLTIFRCFLFSSPLYFGAGIPPE